MSVIIQIVLTCCSRIAHARKHKSFPSRPGDGLSNGAELGDPSCTWSEGSTPSCTGCPSHPGDPNEAVACGDGAQCDAAAHQTRIDVHAVIMGTTWLVLAPLAVYFGANRRFFAREVQKRDSFMLRHKYTAAIVVVATWCGIIVHWTGDSTSSENNSFHGSLGYAIMALILFQPLSWLVFRRKDPMC